MWVSVLKFIFTRSELDIRAFWTQSSSSAGVRVRCPRRRHALLAGGGYAARGPRLCPQHQLSEDRLPHALAHHGVLAGRSLV